MESIHNKKISHLLRSHPIRHDSSTGSHDPEKIVINFSNHVLKEHEKTLLAKGLGFNIPSKRIRCDDYMLPLELLFRDIKDFTPSGNIALVKATLSHTALKTFRSFKLSNSSNLSPAEVAALDSLIADKNIVI